MDKVIWVDFAPEEDESLEEASAYFVRLQEMREKGLDIEDCP